MVPPPGGYQYLPSSSTVRPRQSLHDGGSSVVSRVLSIVGCSCVQQRRRPCDRRVAALSVRVYRIFLPHVQTKLSSQETEARDNNGCRVKLFTNRESRQRGSSTPNNRESLAAATAIRPRPSTLYDCILYNCVPYSSLRQPIARARAVDNRDRRRERRC